MPATARENQLRGVMAIDAARMASGMPGAMRSHTADVAIAQKLGERRARHDTLLAARHLVGQKGRGILSQIVEIPLPAITFWDIIPRPFCPKAATPWRAG